jgi:predicted kinase
MSNINSKNIIILRGVAGAGKSTVAALFANAVTVSADDYFTHSDGSYHFDASKLKLAHEHCQSEFVAHCQSESEMGVETIVVANTNIMPEHFAFYENFAKAMGHKVFHIVIENRHGNQNTHNVPATVLMNMEVNLRDNLTLQ